MSNENEGQPGLMAPAPVRAGIVALVGRANVGKSSLLNAILEEKVSIVSPVAQTTRNIIRGILTEPRGQIAFLDTPGMHKAKGPLGVVMNRMARRMSDGVDLVALVIDGAASLRDEDEGWLRRLVKEQVPFLIVVNKIDAGIAGFTGAQEQLAVLQKEYNDSREIKWIKTSAVKGQGLDLLLKELFERLPVGPPLFPVDVLTDYPRKLNIADLVREKLFAELREELPHAVAVEIQDVIESESGWTVKGVIFVNKSSQKGIVLGEKGRLLRKICRQATAELQNMYEVPVVLELWVKVEKDWSKNFWMLKRLGYVS